MSNPRSLKMVVYQFEGDTIPSIAHLKDVNDVLSKIDDTRRLLWINTAETYPGFPQDYRQGEERAIEESQRMREELYYNAQHNSLMRCLQDIEVLPPKQDDNLEKEDSYSFLRKIKMFIRDLLEGVVSA